MRIIEFLWIVKLNPVRPDKVTSARWAGMMKWYASRIRDNDLMNVLN